jgi:hypothetical protein
MEKADAEREPVHTRENCGPCRLFDPPWSAPMKGPPSGQPTPFELLHGLGEIARATELKAIQARTMRDELPEGSRAWAHADGWRLKFAAEQRHTEAARRRWRSYIDAHPELANVDISTPCRHQVGKGQFPKCWDGATGLYVREAGADDDDEQPLRLVAGDSR